MSASRPLPLNERGRELFEPSRRTRFTCAGRTPRTRRTGGEVQATWTGWNCWAGEVLQCETSISPRDVGGQPSALLQHILPSLPAWWSRQSFPEPYPGKPWHSSLSYQQPAGQCAEMTGGCPHLLGAWRTGRKRSRCCTSLTTAGVPQAAAGHRFSNHAAQQLTRGRQGLRMAGIARNLAQRRNQFAETNREAACGSACTCRTPGLE